LHEQDGPNLESLPEGVMVNLEEDYQICLRMVARAGAAEPAKKARRERGQPGLGI
jgi:hypothetical protein